MTTQHAPRRRVRRFWLGLASVLVLVGVWGVCWWWFILKPTYDERRPFVGTWRLVLPSPTYPARPELVCEMELMFDGTIIERQWDPQTRIVDFNQPSEARWRVSNGRYQEIIHGHDLLYDMAGVGRRTSVVLDSQVSWEGPERFRVQNSFGRTMIWSRTESVVGLQRTHIPIGPE